MSEKKSLRNLLLEKRDNTSFDYLQIASKQIHHKVRKMKIYKESKKIAAYYPIGSEILTMDIIQELLSIGKDVYLPRVIKDMIEFRAVDDFSSLEKSSLGIMEPKESCTRSDNLDLMFVPAVGMSLTGVRLGYGHGFYDRFLAQHKTQTISLILEKQLVQNIPKLNHDVSIDWIVTEDRVINTAN